MQYSSTQDFYDSTTSLSNTQPKAQCFDIIILGAGAAGLMCARTAIARKKRVALVDANAAPGRKISVSGGGRANFTNRHMGSAFFVGEDPSFVDPALEAFPPQRMLDFMAAHKLPWEEREHGQLFGTETAETLVAALQEDCRQGQCNFFLKHKILAARREGDLFHLHCQGTDTSHLTAPSLVLALGSPAWPQVGGSDAGLALARQWGHCSLPFRPALTPLLMPQNWPLQGLEGISLKVGISLPGYMREDDLLFTHAGISGPAVLQASCRWRKGEPVFIDFLPRTNFSQLLDSPEHGKLLTRTLLCRHMPQRLADALLPPDLARRKVAELSRKSRNLLCDCVHKHSVTPTNTGGMRRAEAAAGGVRTVEINAWSMESLKQQGLYLVGELVDITGHLGGYNLHWAWASGSLAGSCA